MSGRSIKARVESEDETEDRRAALALVPVSRETEARLSLYVDRLRRWQTIKNLVGPSTLRHVWTRHIADSAQLVSLAPEALHWVDLGSGAGFPGLVVALMLQGRDGARVDLVESNARKCAFLRDVVRATGAPAIVHAGRIEDVVPTLPIGADVVTSRALAPLRDLIGMGRPLLDAGATGLFLTGGEVETSGEGPARGAANGDRIDTVPSKTHPQGRIVVVRRGILCDSAGEIG